MGLLLAAHHLKHLDLPPIRFILAQIAIQIPRLLFSPRTRKMLEPANVNRLHRISVTHIGDADIARAIRFTDQPIDNVISIGSAATFTIHHITILAYFPSIVNPQKIVQNQGVRANPLKSLNIYFLKYCFKDGSLFGILFQIPLFGSIQEFFLVFSTVQMKFISTLREAYAF